MQLRAIALFRENVLRNGTKSIPDILKEAGYAPESARQGMNIMKGLRPHLDEFVERMKSHRERVMERLETQIETAQYSDLVRSLDVLTHNIQLLGGKPTANIAISADVRAHLDQLIED